jgi:RND family efflux transporter MFP subunit
MKLTYTAAIAIVITSFVMACGESKKENNALLNEKMATLEKLKKEQEKIQSSINTLEGEIALLNPESVNKVLKLVAIDTLKVENFSHMIELQGSIDADNISIVTPRGMGGQVKEIFVKQGDIVQKGKLLLKLDDAIYRQNLIAAQESIKTLKTQLALAQELLKRQENLWKQGIGTEVQLLTARNNAETLQTQIRSAEEQIKVIQEQQKTMNVYAEVSGVADQVNVRVGEFFQGILGTTPQIRIVNTSTLKVVTNVPENYSSRVTKGSKVFIKVPDVDRTYTSNISFLSAAINASNRSFVTEARLPSDAMLKPNMVATVAILDYDAPNAIAIPVNVIQSDASGKYVFVLEKNGTTTVARRRTVAIGQVQGEKVEIKAGLGSGDVLIKAGYQGLYDGQEVSVTETL